MSGSARQGKLGTIRRKYLEPIIFVNNTKKNTIVNTKQQLLKCSLFQSERGKKNMVMVVEVASVNMEGYTLLSVYRHP